MVDGENGTMARPALHIVLSRAYAAVFLLTFLPFFLIRP